MTPVGQVLELLPVGCLAPGARCLPTATHPTQQPTAGRAQGTTPARNRDRARRAPNQPRQHPAGRAPHPRTGGTAGHPNARNCENAGPERRGKEKGHTCCRCRKSGTCAKFARHPHRCTSTASDPPPARCRRTGNDRFNYRLVGALDNWFGERALRYACDGAAPEIVRLGSGPPA